MFCLEKSSSQKPILKKIQRSFFDLVSFMFTLSMHTYNFLIKVTHSFSTKNHELEWLYQPYQVWNKNHWIFLDEYRENFETNVICMDKK